MLAVSAVCCDAGEHDAAETASALAAAPGAAASAAERLLGAVQPATVLDLGAQLDPRELARQYVSVHASTLGAASAAAPASCPALGATAQYGLDLSAFDVPVQLVLSLRAGFDGLLRVERGGLEDPALVACNADHASGVDDALLSLTLEPDRYRIFVMGEGAADAGEFELSLQLLPRAGRCRSAPANDRCADAVALDPEQPRQALYGTTECATDQAQPLWECGNFADRRAEVFYSLDLSRRGEPVLLHASTAVEPVGADVVLYVVREASGECAETLLCSAERGEPGAPAELWAALPPDRYLLAVEERSGRAADFGLLVELGEACSVSNDTCQTAQALEPLPGTQRIIAHPSCGDDSLRSTCERTGPSPDVFYRLDLSGAATPTRVQASTSLHGHSLASLVLLAEHDGTCAGELGCGDFDLWLPPAVYFLALDAFRDQQGPVELSLTLSSDGAPPNATCIDAGIAECARAQDCCDGDGDRCSLVLQSCGLEPAALACLCAADPACCGGPGTSYECGRLLAECGTFCPGFDPAESCP